MVNPLRRIVPSLGRIDTATLLIAFAIEALTLVLIGMIAGQTPDATFLIIYSLVALVGASARIFMFAIIIRIVISWVAPHVHNPATALLNAITEPLAATIPSIATATRRFRPFADIRNYSARRYPFAATRRYSPVDVATYRGAGAKWFIVVAEGGRYRDK